ncbi:strictosidine synthase [Paraburkholderia sediminicola]|uniref:strictosidine synthase n=1 Tax=Paraburkholderia sediminicola TaxID=458836 RepID=UPI0038BDD884
MNSLLTRWFDRFAGRGDYAVTIPVMDGPLRPNSDLDEATAVVEIDAPDNLVRTASGLFFSSHSRLMASRDATCEVVEEFPSTITALASGPHGELAIGLENGQLHLRGTAGDLIVTTLGVHRLLSPVGLLYLPSGELIVVDGSRDNAPSAWQRDLMEMRRSGSVHRYHPGSGESVTLASGLASPAGVCVHPTEPDSLVVAETGRYRLLKIAIDGSGAMATVADDLPGYPFRLVAASDGGVWLSVIAPRNQLIEFVLREPAYRRRMLAEIADPNLWIAPVLSSGKSFLEPLQGGGVKQLGILKPWAPSRSYGLIVHFDRHLNPIASHHSRASGSTHGVTSCVEWESVLYATSKGGGKVVSLRADIGKERA